RKNGPPLRTGFNIKADGAFRSAETGRCYLCTQIRGPPHQGGRENCGAQRSLHNDNGFPARSATRWNRTPVAVVFCNCTDPSPERDVKPIRPEEGEGVPILPGDTTTNLGTRFLIYPQAPHVPGYSKPEPVWISTGPTALQPGPADARIYVRDPGLPK